LVNGAENLKHFRFSKTVFGCVFLSGSQKFPAKLLSPLVYWAVGVLGAVSHRLAQL
jgi:hypothetical protein